MPVFNTQRDLRNGKRYNALSNNRMTDINCLKLTTSFLNAHRSNTDSDSEPYFSVHEAVDEKINNYITLLTKQLDDLTPVIQEMTQVQQTNLPQTASTSSSFRAAGTSSDNNTHV